MIELVDGVIDWVLHGSPLWIHTGTFLIVLAESVVLLGSFVPTLSILVGTGVLAGQGLLQLWLAIAVAATAAICGDRLGHLAGYSGRRRRPALVARNSRLARGWNRTERLIERHGRTAIFVGRFLPVVRTVMPYLTGQSRIAYRELLPYSVIAAIIWATAEVVVGYASIRVGVSLWGG